jgi:hypothetical protein
MASSRFGRMATISMREERPIAAAVPVVDGPLDGKAQSQHAETRMTTITGLVRHGVQSKFSNIVLILSVPGRLRHCSRFFVARGWSCWRGLPRLRPIRRP